MGMGIDWRVLRQQVNETRAIKKANADALAFSLALTGMSTGTLNVMPHH
jgi:hypothetical protein